MITVIGWSPESIWDLTLKDIFIAYDTKLLSDWDRTSVIASHLYNLGCLTIALNSKARPKFKGPIEMNPFRKSEREGIKVDASDVSPLKLFLKLK